MISMEEKYNKDFKRKKEKRRMSGGLRIPRCMKAKGNIPNEGKTRIPKGQRG